MLAPTRLLVLVITALALAGCGGESSPAEIDGTGPELVAEAAEALSNAESYRARFEGIVGLEGGAALTGGLVGEEQPISGEARISGDSAAVDLAADLGITQLQVTLTRTSNGAWLGLLGQDYSLDLPDDTIDRLDPERLAPAVVGWISDPQISGTQIRDGATVAVVTGTVDPDALLSDLSAVTGAAVDPAAAQQVRDALTEGEIEMLIGDDRLPRAIDVRVVLDGRIDALDIDGALVDLEVALSDFGEDITIAEPEDAQPFSLDDLGAFAP